MNKSSYVQTHPELPTLEMLCYAHSEIKFKVYQSITRTPTQNEIPIILDEYYNGKRNIHREINETAKRVNEKYNWIGLTKDVEYFIEKCEIGQNENLQEKT